MAKRVRYASLDTEFDVVVDLTMLSPAVRRALFALQRSGDCIIVLLPLSFAGVIFILCDAWTRWTA